MHTSQRSAMARFVVPLAVLGFRWLSCISTGSPVLEALSLVTLLLYLVISFRWTWDLKTFVYHPSHREPCVYPSNGDWLFEFINGNKCVYSSAFCTEIWIQTNKHFPKSSLRYHFMIMGGSECKHNNPVKRLTTGSILLTWIKCNPSMDK